MVSVEPIITEATLPGKLSGPKDLKIESTRAKEPLPEIGRNSMRGIVSFGTAIKFPMGASKEVIMSSAPEAFNMETATINPISEGAIEKVEKKPYSDYTEYNYVFTNLSKNLKKEANGK